MMKINYGYVGFYEDDIHYFRGYPEIIKKELGLWVVPSGSAVFHRKEISDLIGPNGTEKFREFLLDIIKYLKDVDTNILVERMIYDSELRKNGSEIINKLGHKMIIQF